MAAVQRGITACVVLFMGGAASGADNILIGRGDCDSGVHLVAHGARASDVLRRLAEALDFQLQLNDPNDSVVDVDVSKQAPELVANLSPFDNLIVAQDRNPDCPGKYRIVKVWMLSKGSQVPQPPAGTSLMPRPLTEAEKKLMREGEETYRKAHGMPLADDGDDSAN